jgi:hypothetical protein
MTLKKLASKIRVSVSEVTVSVCLSIEGTELVADYEDITTAYLQALADNRNGAPVKVGIVNVEVEAEENDDA